MRLSVLGFSVCIVFTAMAATSQAAESVWTSKRKNRNSGPPVAIVPSAGEYSCHTLAVGGSIATPYGAVPTVTPMPSGIVSVQLDGKNSYRHSSGNGRYRYEAASGTLIMESGPFEGWAVRSESDGQSRWLRFAAKKGADLAPKSQLGDHICPLK